MTAGQLAKIAERVVGNALARLPEEIRSVAEECPVRYEWSEALRDEGLEDDLLGLFEGADRLAPTPDDPFHMPRIRLFLDNVWDEAGGDLREFQEEIRVTFLHELGHYLGLDEEGVEGLGLG